MDFFAFLAALSLQVLLILLAALFAISKKKRKSPLFLTFFNVCIVRLARFCLLTANICSSGSILVRFWKQVAGTVQRVTQSFLNSLWFTLFWLFSTYMYSMFSAIFPKSFSHFRENLMTRQVFLIVVPTVSQRALQLLMRDFTTTLSECPWKCVVTILVCLSVICFETSKFFPIMLPEPLKVWPLQLTSFKWNPIKISLRAFTVVSLIKLFNS